MPPKGQKAAAAARQRGRRRERKNIPRGQAHVLEANAFGDLLPGLLWQGLDTYGLHMRDA